MEDDATLPEEPSKNSPEASDATYESLVTEIEREVISLGCSIWGHGTSSREIAEKILKEGILASPNYSLTEIASPVNTVSKPPHEQAQELVDFTSAWPHRDATAVVLIALPDGFRPHQIVEEIDSEGRIQHRVPERFLVGLLDASTLEFIKNPRFEQFPQPTTVNPSEFPQGIRWNRKANSHVTPTEVGDSDPDSWVW